MSDVSDVSEQPSDVSDVSDQLSDVSDVSDQLSDVSEQPSQVYEDEEREQEEDEEEKSKKLNLFSPESIFPKDETFMVESSIFDIGLDQSDQPSQPSEISLEPSQDVLRQVYNRLYEFIKNKGKAWNRELKDLEGGSSEDVEFLLNILRDTRTKLNKEIKDLESSYLQYYKSWLPYTTKREEVTKQFKEEINLIDNLGKELYDLWLDDERKTKILEASKELRESDYFDWRYETIPGYNKDYRNDIKDYSIILKKLEDENRIRDLHEVLIQILDGELKEISGIQVFKLSFTREEKEKGEQLLKDFKEKLDLGNILLKTDILKKELTKLEKETDKLSLKEELEDTMLEGLAFRNKKNKRKSRRLPTRK